MKLLKMYKLIFLKKGLTKLKQFEKKKASKDVV